MRTDPTDLSGAGTFRAVTFLALFLGPAAVAQEARAPAEDLAGVWEGAIVTRPAVLELDIRLDVVEEDGAVSAALSAPPRGVERQPVEDLAIGDGRLSFVFLDGEERSRFEGTVDSEGGRIDGKVTEESGTYDFFLERSDAAGEPGAPEVAVLEGGASDLAEAFRTASGETRMVVIVSPSCLICKVGLRLLDRYVLREVPDDLSVFVVWEDIRPQDDLELARQAAALLSDPRARHFWSADRAVGKAFHPYFEASEGPVWDVFLVFGPDSTWSDTPPEPGFYMHNNGDLPDALRLHGERLRTEVESLRKAGGLLSLLGADCNCGDEPEDDADGQPGDG